MLFAALAMSARADVIMDWNARADVITAEKRMPPPVQARTLALMHVSMFEAINAIERRYQPYRLALVVDRNSSREAAAASAAHTVLTVLFADQRTALDAHLAGDLAAIAQGPARERGLLVGRKAAVDLLELHADDGKGVDDYRPFTQAGMYVPTQPVHGYLVGAFKPWVMSSAAQFRPSPPPALTSEAWTRDVNEIREYGASKSATRSEDQTTAGRFWFLTGARTYNPIVRQVVIARKMNLLDCARVYALASMAAADAFVAVFEAKYHYNFWRPVTAIRNADLSQNPATPSDPTWQPLGDTPMHPEYPCAHCISASAVAATLHAIAGDEVGEISLTSTTAPGVTRRWTRVSDYADEVSNARIWAGFHYRFSAEAGKDMGRKIGELTVTTQLRPRK
ncbi:MAG TPA: vanadium-dependent haloperoxidase [Steroidobacteraceae bacterium]|nr:vanadium-dependent haloperoxidase [Steroidobacteraceae bacterium]